MDRVQSFFYSVRLGVFLIYALISIGNRAQAAAIGESFMMECSDGISNVMITLPTVVECGSPQTATVTADVTASVYDSVIVDFMLPPGFSYAGNLIGADTVDISAISVRADISGGVLNFSFDIRGECGVGDEDGVDFNFWYILDAGTMMPDTITCTNTSDALNTDDIALSIAPPNTPGRNTEERILAVLNEVDTLVSTIVQEGDGTIDTVFYVIDDHPLMILEGVVYCETGEPLQFIKSVGGKSYYGIGGAGMMISDGIPGFNRNEGIDICEIWKVTDCPDGSVPDTRSQVSTSCDLDAETSVCQEDSFGAFLDFEALLPSINHNIDASIPFDPICQATDPYDLGYIFINNGGAPAGRLQANLTEYAGGTAFDLTSITYQIGSSGPIENFVDNGTDTDATSLRNTEVSSCVDAEYPTQSPDLYNRARLEFSNIDFPPGDTMFLRFTVYPRPCGCSTCDVPRRGGSDIDDIDAWTLCDDKAQSEEINASVAWPNFDVDFSSFMEAPAITCDGEVSALSTTVANYANSYLNNQGFNGNDDGERNTVYFNDEGACVSCYLEIVYEIPNGLDYVPGSVMWDDNDGTGWVPDVESYLDNDGGVDIVTLRWTGSPPSGWDAYAEASLVTIDFTPDCGLDGTEVDYGPTCTPILYDDEVTKTVRWSQSGDCVECIETVECTESLPVSIKCPGRDMMCVCDGFVQTLAEGRRSNLYDPDEDNDGCYEIGETYDEDLIRRDRFVKGDSLEVEMAGTLQLNSGAIGSVDYIYAEVNMPISNYIPLGGVATIIDATDGMTYTCDILTQTIEAGNILLTDLSIPRMAANGCTVPPNFEDGDSVHVKFYYTVNETFTGEVDIQSYRTDMYASETANGSKLSCTLPLDFRLTQVGLQSSFRFFTWSSETNFSGCEVTTMYYRGYSRVGSANVDFFPGEYFDFVEEIPQARFNVPDGMIFRDIHFHLRRKNSSGNTTVGGGITTYANSALGNTGFSSSGYTVNASHPSVTLVGDQIIFDVDAFMLEQFGDEDLPCSDEGYSWSFQPNYLPSCNLEAGTIDTFFSETDHVTNEAIFCSVGYSDEGFRSGINYEGGAEILIESVTGIVEVNAFPTCAIFRVTNIGTEVANNVWMSLESLTNDIIVQSVSEIQGDDKIAITGNALNLYQLGNIVPGGSSSSLFEVCAVVNSCESDFLDIYAGYDCVGYPTIREEAVCSSTDVIEFVPVEAALSMSATVPDAPITIDLCDTVTHVVDLNAAGPGFLSDVWVDIRLPNNVDFVPGSFEIAYPTSATPGNPAPDNEYEPAPDPTLLFGSRYRFLVDEADSILNADGLIGSAGSAFNLNVVNIRYKVVTGCGYASGSKIRYFSNAKSGCGANLRPVKRDRSERMNIFGAPDPFVSEINLAADTLNACSSDVTAIDISYQINGDMPTTDEDSIRVILPAGIAYVNGSYRSGNSPLPDPPLTQNEDGQDLLYWGINGLTPGEAVTFSFDIQGVDIGQDCDDYELIVQTFKSATAYCATTMDTCVVRSISNEGSADIFIIKPELEVSEAFATNGMLMGDEEMIDYSFTITNNGTVDSDASTDVIIDLYGDTDGDCRLTPGVDTLLTSMTFNVALTPGESIEVNQTATIPVGYSCSLMAVIDNDKNCSCETTTSSCIRAELDLKLEEDVEVCSDELVALGPPAIDAYDYTWSALGGADITAIDTLTTSPTNFQYDNNVGTDIVWEYGVRVDRATGCYTFDTVSVTVFPETEGAITTEVCNPIPGCGDPVTGFFLSGPIDGTDYSWSILSGDMSVGFIDNSDTLADAEVDGLINQTTTFLLNYNDLNGCPATFEQTVNLTNCACTSLGDTVWFDLDIDGAQDIGEPGIPGVTVFLYEANDITTPIQSTVTNADGYYIFQPLPSGNYVVSFDKSTHTSPYHILEPTLQDVGADDTDSDADPITGYTGAYFIPNGISDLTVDAGFYPGFDLALFKQVNTDLSPGPYFAGDTINYTITVINQGGYYGATDIEVVDYITPGELTYLTGSNGATSSANGIPTTITENGGGTFTIDTLAPLDTIEIDLQFRIDAGFTGTSLVNYAEISDFTNEVGIPDSDSNADNVNSDPGGTPGSNQDDHIDDDGSDTDGDGITDEDDHDPALVEIQEIDLALIKKIDNTYTTIPANIGDKVKFDIIVINQGDLPVEDVVVEDYMPNGYTFNISDPDNVAQGWDNNLMTTVPGILLPGDRDTVSIYLTVQLSFDDSDYINAAEIISANDTVTGRNIAPYDVDSTPDSNTAAEQATAPNTSGDNNIISTGDSDNGSQDDHDIATIPVVYPILEISKTHESTVPNGMGPNCYDITYRIEVDNVGLAPGSYDLIDNPAFDADIEVDPFVTVSHNVAGRTTPLTLVYSPNIELANDQSIAGGTQDRYFTTFSVCLDLEDGVTGDDMYTPCGDASGGGESVQNEGAFNSASIEDTDFTGLYDSSDSTCTDLPYLIIDKMISSSTEQADGSFTTVYTIVVQNIGGDSIKYDLYDHPQYDDDITINSASYTSDTPNSGTLPMMPGSGWLLADSTNIDAGSMHNYSVTVNTSIDLSDGIGNDSYDACGSGAGGASEAGDGLFNEAYLDVNFDMMPDLQDTACQDLPFLTMVKSLSMVDGPKADGTYDVIYTIAVSNLGSVPDDYDLYDEPNFEDDIEILGVTYTSDHPINMSGSFGLAVPAGGWQIANGDIIPGMTTYTYTLTINVQMDLTDGTIGDDMYLACNAGAGSGPTGGEGLFNEAALDANEDGMPEVLDTACADLPFIEVAKSFDSLVETSLNCYDVYYTIIVKNSGGASEEYDLDDNPAYDDDFVISNFSFTSSTTNMSASVSPSGGVYPLATDQMIDPMTMDTFNIVVSTCIDLEDGMGDDMYTASCGNATGGMDPSPMEGMYNEAQIDLNDDGITDVMDDACADVPYLIITKSLTNREQLTDSTYRIIYSIEVTNLGGADGEYNLYDLPQPDDDVVFTDAEYTSNVAGNMGPTTLTPVMPLPASPGWTVATNQSILPGGVDVYILTVEAEVDLDVGDSVGDNIFTSCGSGANPDGSSGEGLYNEAFLDSNTDGIVDDSADVCLDLPSLFMDKNLVSLTGPLPDGSYNVVYEIVVSNRGGATATYDLSDTIFYDDDVIVNSAMFTSNAGNSNAMLSTIAPYGWELADSTELDPLPAVPHTYVVTVNVLLDLDDGTGDNTYTACGSTLGGVDGPGMGLYNRAYLDENRDGTPDEVNDACGDLPNIKMTKEIFDVVQTAANCYDILYRITVTNDGGATGQYDLIDSVGFDDDFEIAGALYTTTAQGLSPFNLSGTSSPYTLADDQEIVAGKSDVYLLTLSVCIDLEDPGSVGDEVYTAGCGEGSGGVPMPGQGLHNTAYIDVNNDGTRDEEDEDCADVPYLVIRKTITSSMELPDGSFDVVYLIEVENLGRDTGYYDLSDEPQFDDDVTINAASYSSPNTSNGNPALGNVIPTGGWILANDEEIDALEIDSFSLTINMSLDLMDGMGDDIYTACGSGAGGAPVAGDGAFNSATIDVNNDGMDDSSAEACQDLPFLTMEKSVAMISDQLADGSYNVTYEITVTNEGGLADNYDLFDLPAFDNDITINSASFSSDIPTSNPALPATPPITGWELANGEVIAAMDEHLYTVVVNVDIDLLDGMVDGDDIYNGCGSASGGASPAAGEGLFNTAILDASGDGIPEVIDTACGDLPFLVLDKMHDSTVVTSLNCYDVYYTLTVENLGGAEGTYDLSDSPGFDSDFEISVATYTTSIPGFLPNNLVPGSVYDLADDQPISGGVTDTFNLKFEVCIDLENSSSPGNEVYEASCGDSAGGDDSTDGEGLHNEAYLDTNNDGNTDQTSEACDDVPYFLMDKKAKSVTEVAPYTYEVIYEIEVQNIGGDTGTYDLTDLPQFDDDIIVDTSYYSSNTANMGSLALPPPVDGWVLADDQSIEAGMTHTYTVTSLVTYNFFDTIGNNTYTACGDGGNATGAPGEGLFNEALLDVNNDGADDIIDQDCEDIDAFDLALKKELVTEGPYNYGDIITYRIYVINQGTQDASDIRVIDHIPCGLRYDPGRLTNIINFWTPAVTTTPISSIFNIPSGSVDSLDIELILEECGTATDFTNIAEIFFARDESNLPGNDVDSDPDPNPTNDIGGTPRTDEDNHIDDDRTDFNMDGITDEDDHDPEQIEIFDLALKKELLTAGPYNYGDSIDFNIIVCNQGNIGATDISVEDYVPAGYIFDQAYNAGWSDVSGGAVYTITDTIAANQCDTIPLKLTIGRTSGGEKDWINYAEIIGASNEDGENRDDWDIDSNPDSNGPDETSVEPNDPADDDLSSSDKGGEEDDHDPAGIEIYDLAQRKVQMSSGPYVYGDTIEYSIDVFNQGSIASSGIELKDHLPCGLAYDSSNDAIGWSLQGDTATLTIGSIIPAGGDTSIVFRAIVQQCIDMDATSFTNVSEISDSESEDPDEDPEDIDSDEDEDPDNDGDPVDDATQDPNDEDDHDEEIVEIFDLALRKELVTMGPYAYGDTLLFMHEVCNQGNVEAQRIEITDYVPAGYSFSGDNMGWTMVDDSTYTYSVPGLLPADSCVMTAPLRLILERTSGGEKDWINYSELSDYDDDGDDMNTPPVDADSTPDSDGDGERDVEPVDDADDDIESTDAGGEEDDHDPAGIEVYDLAQRKVEVSSGPYVYGDTIEYSIDVFNQGSIASSGIELKDHLPCGLAYDSSNDAIGWSLVGDTATLTIGSIIPAGGDTSIVFRAIVQQCLDMDATSFTNVSEISDSESEDPDEDPEDIDSDEDEDPDNDGDPVDDEVDDPMDEDDHDEELVEIFDLAMAKILVDSMGPYAYGDTLEFVHIVCNQGNVSADTIAITDHVPPGFSFSGDNMGWMMVDDSTYTYAYGDELPGDSCVNIAPLRLILERTSGGEKDWMNYSEISYFDDDNDPNNDPPVDADSTPDSDGDGERDVEPGDDADDDLESTDSGGEEDDHDPAGIEVYDLAQRKVEVSSGPYVYGDTIEYSIDVFNQGSIASSDIELKDHLPCGLAYDSSNDAIGWSLVGDTATLTISNVIPAGGDTSIVFRAIVQQCLDMDATSFTNVSEISDSDSEDPDEDPEDIDSDEDEDPDNDGDPVDDEVDDPMDEDDHDEELVEIFDLAMAKILVDSMGPYAYGDTLEFVHIVCNQGNVSADTIAITDHVPPGFSFSGDNMGWTMVDDSTYTYAYGDELPGDSCVNIAPLRLILERTSGGEKDWMNYSEISYFDDDNDPNNDPPVDADSTPDSDGDGERDVEPGDDADDDLESTDSGGEEDDHDPAGIEVYDLAQRKVEVSSGPYVYGDTIEYSIDVFNQGSIASSGIELKDHLPCGLAYDMSNDAIGWSLVGDTATLTISNVIPAGGDTSIVFRAIVQQCLDMDATSFTNVSEISDSESEDPDEDPEDIDSDEDEDPDNDGDPVDDEVDDPMDEDDHDEELVEIFDLAMAKILVDSMGPYAYGDTLEFVHIVCNQGNVSADTIAITDHVPPGFSFSGDNMGWTMVDDSTYTYAYGDELPGDSCVNIAPLRLILERTSGGEKDWMNYSEISYFDDDNDPNNDPPVDADSTPDSDGDGERDVEPGDDADDDLESTDSGGEEDDHDPAGIEVYDLAQRKVEVSSGPYVYGDTIEYSIDVFNQGSIASSGIELKDHLPCGLAYDMSNDAIGWSLVGDTATLTISNVIPAGGDTSIVFRAIVQQCLDMDATSFTNVSEISDSESEDPDEDPEDIDSDEDEDPDNDGDPVDDEVDDPMDEDDHDEELVEIFDLAMAKILVDSMGPYAYGDTLEFVHIVCNQGNVSADTIAIIDHVPAGFSFSGDNMGWTMVDDSTYTYAYGVELPGDSCVNIAPLRLILERTSGGEKDWMNYSEISYFDDDNDPNNDPPVDADSTPDSDGDGERDVEPGDDADDDIESTDAGGEEDDHDPAGIEVYDLAQRKVEVSSGPYVYGDTIEYSIDVFNQGSIASSGIELKDHLPCGLAYDSSNDAIGWSLVGDTATLTISNVIPAGGDTSIVFRAIVQQCIDMDAASFTNISEISDSDSTDPDEDPDDIDSDEDEDPDNDGDPVDDEIDDPIDEDDHDEELIEIFDLALRKELVTMGPYTYGDTLLFMHEVCNQGNVEAQRIEITDYVPAGYSFSGDNMGWTMVNDSTYNYAVPGLLPADSCVMTAPLRLILERTSGGEKDWINYSELSDYDDDGDDMNTPPTDADSTPDSDGDGERDVEPGDDADDDLESTDSGGEEDDHDPAGIEVYDLAQRKVEVSSGPYSYGDTIEYSIDVFNQGSIASDSIVLRDYLPCGLAYDISNDAIGWSLVGDTAEYLIVTELAAGESISIEFTAIVQQCIDMDAASFTNISEISDSDSTDPDEDPDDIDSDEDEDPDNDGDPVDDEIDDPIDEDDHDEELIEIFDLALRKELVTMGPYTYGDTLLFMHEVCNQGNVEAQRIEITDYVPVGYSFSGDNMGWTMVDDSTYTYAVPGLLPADSCVMTAPLRLILESTTGGYKHWINYSELSDYDDDSDDMNMPPMDADSNPDSDGPDERDVEPGDDADDDLESTDQGGEEDDHDPAGIEIVDFALRKTAITEGPYFPGDQIHYHITVFNQGSVPSSELVVYDHIPVGLDYINDISLNAGWNIINDKLVSFTYKESILPGDSAILNIYLTPNGEDLSAEGVTNIAEVGGVIDEEGIDVTDEDIDSDPDIFDDNDEGGIPNSDTDDTIDNENGDEDDADPQEVCSINIICPDDIVDAECYVEPFGTPEEAGFMMGDGDECEGIIVDFNFEDQITPADCQNGQYFESREVIRTYNYSSVEGGFDRDCEQSITYEFTECNQALNAGTIAIGDNNDIIYSIPSMCPDIPEIGDYIPASVNSSCAEPLEYMWLVSTIERTNGEPYIPNSFNMGALGSDAIWQIIPGAVDPNYRPDEITQNTYYVRCTRTISCCEFMETNLVGFRIDEDPMATCPIIISTEPQGDDCEEDIILTNPTDNMMSAQQTEYNTNRTITADNMIGNGANLKLNAKEGTTLNPGFEVMPNGQLEVQTDGCNNQE